MDRACQGLLEDVRKLGKEEGRGGRGGESPPYVCWPTQWANSVQESRRARVGHQVTTHLVTKIQAVLDNLIVSPGRPAWSACLAFQGRLYAVGGHDGHSSLSTVEMYDPSTNIWTLVADMSVARWGSAVALIQRPRTQ